MIKRITSFTSLLALVSASFAADVSELISTLDSDNYVARQSARLELRQVLLDTPSAERGASEAQLIQSSEAGEPYATRDWTIRMLELTGDEASVAPLAALLNDPDAHIRDCARRALASNPSPKATQALVVALQRDAQRGYLDALAYRGDPESITAIAAVLSNRSPELASHAALALGKIGGADASAALLSQYAKADDALKNAIELALLDGGLDSPDAARVLSTKGSTGAVRVAAYQYLVEMNESEAVNTLKLVLGDESFPRRAAMIRVAVSSPISEDAIGLLSSMSDADQMVVLGAIADQDMTQYEEAVLSLLDSPSSEVKQVAIRTLGVVGSIKSYQPLYTLYLQNTGDSTVSEALARLQAPSADESLLKAASTAGNPEVRIAALQLLTLRNTNGVTALVNQLALADNPDDLRKATFKSMETVGDGASVQCLLNVVLTQDSVMRQAQGSVKKLSTSMSVPDYQWSNYYEPALESAPNDDARKAVLAVLDGVSGSAAAEYLEQLILSNSPLRADALKSLSRWSDISGANVWVAIYNSPAASEADKTAALRGLKRLLSQKGISGDARGKVRLAASFIKEASSAELKQAIVSSYEGRRLDRDTGREVKGSFKQFKSDPDVGAQVQGLL